MIIIFLTVFSFYYTDKVIELSNHNNIILASIDEYASLNDTKCIEGSINEDGIILGLSGLVVDKNKSYSNMKGIGFKSELLEYKENKCILNKIDNLDKYIISGNKVNKNISLVIDVENKKYYKQMIDVLESYNLKGNLLTNKYIEDYNYNVLFKGNEEELKKFKKNYEEFYCVKTSDYEIIDICKSEKINSIKVVNYIEDNLLINTKKILSNGTIIFIKETNSNLKELSSTIKYIQSRGFKIVDINELLT